MDSRADGEWKEDSDHTIANKLPEIFATVDEWPEVVREMISQTERMMTIGLFDRPPLSPEQWSFGRCVIVGESAHPGTPHVGQGANQALEDCYHLAQLLPGPDELSSFAWREHFLEYAKIREPPTTILVREARKMGELFVVKDGSEQGRRARDELVKGFWNDSDAVQSFYDMMYSQPFDDRGGLARAQACA